VHIDAVRTLRVAWKPGTAEGKPDASVLKELRAAEPSMGLPPLTPTVEASFTVRLRSNSVLERPTARSPTYGPTGRRSERLLPAGQIMAAVALVRRVAEEGREITEADLDGIRNIRRCGTCPGIRETIGAGARDM
jgi:hypothetical protein